MTYNEQQSEEQMPEISRFLGIIIRMFFAGKEHNPPHFHAYYGDESAVFSIGTLEVIRGSLPPRVKGLVIEWADLHRDELMNNWELLKVGEHKKIKPLV